MVWLALLTTLATGALLAQAALRRYAMERTVRVFLMAGLAVLIGAGAHSGLYTVLLWSGLAGRRQLFIAETLLLAAAIWIAMKAPGAPATVKAGNRFHWAWVGYLAATTGILLACAACFVQMEANPAGDYDAFAIWNLRGKFLASPTDWRHALAVSQGSQMFGVTHPGYPWLVSAYVARTWLWSGDVSQNAPQAFALLMMVAGVALLAGAVAWARGVAAGAWAALVWVASSGFWIQAAWQYADVPLALYGLGTVALLGLAVSRGGDVVLMGLAGLSAGFACWTKNEGLPLALGAVAAAAVACCWPARSAFLFGLLPGGALTLIHKLVFAPPGVDLTLPSSFGGVAEQLMQPARYVQIAAAWGRALIEMGSAWTHPVTMLGLAVWVLREGPERRTALWAALPLGVTLAAQLATMVLTTSDLAWQLNTSADRLLAQLWPGLICAMFLMLGTFEGQAMEEAVRKGKKIRS